MAVEKQYANSFVGTKLSYKMIVPRKARKIISKYLKSEEKEELFEAMRNIDFLCRSEGLNPRTGEFEKYEHTNENENYKKFEHFVGLAKERHEKNMNIEKNGRQSK